MTRGPTVLLVRGEGRGALALCVSAWSALGLSLIALAALSAWVWLGFHLGELTFRP